MKRDFKLKIAEIFYSIQGEIDVGVPSIFIRFSGCNLIGSKRACKWCDSLFAEKTFRELTLEQVLKEVKKYDCKNVVITGGEPLYHITGLRSLVFKLGDEGYRVVIETNGTIYDDILKYASRVSCSPKRQSTSPLILSKINNLSNVRFKFVYEKDLWFEEVIKKSDIKPSKVWIMPEGKTKSKQEREMKRVVEYCKKNKFNFTPRLHILVWDMKRSV